MPQFKKILCPIDFDQNSPLQLRMASELAQEHKTTLQVLHVVAIPAGPEVALPFEKMEATARAKLERLAGQKVGRNARYEVHARSGDPAIEILQVAKRLGTDLIVMATHGRKGFRRLILGSVAEQVIRQAPCPVLAVKPKPARRTRVRNAAQA